MENLQGRRRYFHVCFNSCFLRNSLFDFHWFYFFCLWFFIDFIFFLRLPFRIDSVSLNSIYISICRWNEANIFIFTLMFTAQLVVQTAVKSFKYCQINLKVEARGDLLIFSENVFRMLDSRYLLSLEIIEHLGYTHFRHPSPRLYFVDKVLCWNRSPTQLMILLAM